LIRKENTRYKDLTITFEPLEERLFRAQEDGVRCVTDALNYDQERADLLQRLTAVFAGNERLAIILMLRKVDKLTARKVAAMFGLSTSTINALTRKAVALYRDRCPQNGNRA
jgi:DNA-directed RNA polymerase specialized sigma24 family protein